MNVLLVARWPAGGIRTYFRDIYSKPYFENVKFKLVAPDLNLFPFLETTGLDSRIDFLPVKNDRMSLVKTTRKLIKKYEFDLLHSHGFSAGVLCELFLPKKKIKHLMTAHDVFLPSQFLGWKGKVNKKLIGTTLGRIDHIHTVTDDARKNLMEFFPALKPSKIHNILHGVDTARLAEANPIDLKSELKIEQSRPLIGFFGRFMGQKGFRDLVDALRLIVNDKEISVHPKVATFGWGGFIREDYQYLGEIGLSEFFIQMPHTDNMPVVLKSVDMVVMPSYWEACGLLAMETLAAGTPLIATNCIGLREILNDTPAEIVAPGDSVALASAIRNFMANSPKVTFESFAPFARARFSSERPSRALSNLYLELTSSKKLNE